MWLTQIYCSGPLSTISPLRDDSSNTDYYYCCSKWCLSCASNSSLTHCFLFCCCVVQSLSRVQLCKKHLPWAENTDAHGWPWHWGVYLVTLPHGGYWAQSVLKKISLSLYRDENFASRKAPAAASEKKNTELDISSFNSSHLWDLFSSTIKWH